MSRFAIGQVLGALWLSVAVLLALEATAAEPDRWLDASERYQAYLDDGRLDREHIDGFFEQVRPRLEGVTLLFVPSWLSDQARMAGETLGVVEYMESQVAAMRRLGLAAEIADINTEDSVPANALVIERRVKGGQDPVCIVSHSKGGLDTLEFLLRTDPATRAKVVCWVALQAPFAGSPLADLASDLQPMRWIARELLTALGGSERSLLDLREDTRRAYLATFDTEIEALAARLPILGFATFVESNGPGGLPTYASAELMNFLNGAPRPNDGLLPVDSAILPHARYVVAGGIDHNMTVRTFLALADPLDRVALTKLLLALVLTLDRT